MKFYKCTYDEYQYIWLKERVSNFLTANYNINSTIDQLTDQFLALNQNQDREAVKKIIGEILNSM